MDWIVFYCGWFIFIIDQNVEPTSPTVSVVIIKNIYEKRIYLYFLIKLCLAMFQLS